MGVLPAMAPLKLMCFDININGNRDVKFLECDYLFVQRSVKLTLIGLMEAGGQSRLTVSLKKY